MFENRIGIWQPAKPRPPMTILRIIRDRPNEDTPPTCFPSAYIILSAMIRYFSLNSLSRPLKTNSSLSLALSRASDLYSFAFTVSFLLE